MRLLRSTVCLAVLGTVVGCNCGHGTSPDGGSGGAGASGGGDAGAGGGTADAGASVFTDFSSTPVIVGTLPTDIGTQFTGINDGGGASGPCLVEPTLGALIPTNWSPLYLEWHSLGSGYVYEVRVHVANQTNDFLGYTADTKLEMPDAVWAALTRHSAGHALTLTLRAAQFSGSTLMAGPFLGVSGDVLLAPVAAEGNIVYWTTTNGSALKGFAIGSKTPTLVVSASPPNTSHTCVACHTSSPDGKYAFISTKDTGNFFVDAFTVDGMQKHVDPMDVTPNALTNLARQDQTLPQLSLAHYSATDAIAITELNGELTWTDLHATTGGTGTLARAGDTRSSALPSFSHDGVMIVYVSTTQVIDGRSGSDPTDLYSIPYNDHNGGSATKILGASDPNVNETYPTLSSDDVLLAFDEMPVGNTYDEPRAEVYVMMMGSGAAQRATANDPPACSGKASPGLTNSWPRWSPSPVTVGSRRYYWLTFSSTRHEASNGMPQLYVSGVVVDNSTATPTITTYPALYVRSQIESEANHTPAWDVFQITIN